MKEKNFQLLLYLFFDNLKAKGVPLFNQNYLMRKHAINYNRHVVCYYV